MVVVTGVLAAPYGQLEIRPTAGQRRRSMARARCPSPFAVPASGLGEVDRGPPRHDARAPDREAVPIVERRPDVPLRTGGRLAVHRPVGRVERPGGDLGPGEGHVPRRRHRRSAGNPLRRARWLQDLGPRSERPEAAVRGRRHPHRAGRPARARRPGCARPISIAQALRQARREGRHRSDRDRDGDACSTPPGDGSSCRTRPAAVEVLLPVGTARLPVGARVRLAGTMGTAYGAPRLRSTDVDRLGGSASVAPLRLYAAPTAAHVWRLVVVTGRIADVHKLGDRWRAELVVGSARLPIVGQAGAGIPVDRVIEGRTATVVGIVRAAYPSASDKRASILPRSAADLQVGAAATAESGSANASGSGAAAALGAGTAAGGLAPDDLARPDDPCRRRPRRSRDLRGPDRAGRRRRHGARPPTGSRSTTARPSATVVVTGEARRATRPGRAGRHRERRRHRDTRRDAGWIVTASAPDAIGRAGDPIATIDDARGRRCHDRSVIGAELASTSPASTCRAPVRAGLAGLGTLVALSVISLVVTVAVRRQRARLALASRISRRLAAVSPAGHARDRIGPRWPGRAWPSTIHARATQLDAREKAGLSSAEFRASEAAT